jgi:hypothetical protein
MTTLAQASLSTEERALLTRFSSAMYAEEELEPEAV